ncbi:expressed unknown protein [Seminavis robusta]|uniref:Uncharacterized protein n=1 Tax=Seminavis robusta TaxID=568900 RepID=A0A9N8EL28_9STRA|nr:expressed unknown protein [Seminavis robusta]|eukprot:Sro1142_g245750.1 n/a (471) ;mRNA; f:3006-4616
MTFLTSLSTTTSTTMRRHLLRRASTRRQPRRRQHQQRGIKSLAFTTHFLHPDLGMTDYEKLSRSTAFLLAVDPPDPTGEGPYGHLEVTQHQRTVRDFQRQHNYTPAMGGTGTAKDMGWLEFMPREHRPNVHVITSSHVVSPFLWLDYYPYDWLTQVKQEHCKYTLEVFDSKTSNKEPLRSYELHNTPIHHPEGRDVVFVHLQDEETALDEMKKLGVDVHYLRNPDKLFEKGETIYFDGYVVHDPQNAATTNDNTPNDLTVEDTRVFEPYQETGTLAFHTNDRFFATTPHPLPEGLCGAPAIDADGELCGIVEGIVPVDHENTTIAGSAAFLPSFVLAAFVEYVERYMLEQMMPKDMFQNVVRAKETNAVGGGSFSVGKDGMPASEQSWEEAFEKQVASMKKKYSKEEMDAILWNVKRERDEVMKIMNEEGGDLEEAIARVRAETLAMRQHAIEEYKKKGGLAAEDKGGKS